MYNTKQRVFKILSRKISHARTEYKIQERDKQNKWSDVCCIVEGYPDMVLLFSCEFGAVDFIKTYYGEDSIIEYEWRPL